MTRVPGIRTQEVVVEIPVCSIVGKKIKRASAHFLEGVKKKGRMEADSGGATSFSYIGEEGEKKKKEETQAVAPVAPKRGGKACFSVIGKEKKKKNAPQRAARRSSYQWEKEKKGED